MRTAVLCLCCVGVTWLTGCLGSDNSPAQTTKSDAADGAVRTRFLADASSPLLLRELSLTAFADDANRFEPNSRAAETGSAANSIFESGSGTQAEWSCSSGSMVPQRGKYGELLDPVTRELISSLRESRTVVIWLFDASLSLKPSRDQIASRFEKIHRQLAAFDPRFTTYLSNIVASFGQELDVITEVPVTDIEDLIPKIRHLKDDLSGKEMVFTAVKELARTSRKYRTQAGRENVRIFLFTDERGDDASLLDDAINECLTHAVVVYVVGRGSTLGRQQRFVHWKYDNGFEEEIPIDSGSETYEPDLATVGAFGSDDLQQTLIPSGFGPYSLSQLCSFTGGLYLVSEELRSPVTFSPDVMGNYAPDLRLRKLYERDMKLSLCKQSLVEAARLSQKHRAAVQSLPVVFQADSNDVLQQQLAAAQKLAGVETVNVDELLALLSKGETDRPNVNEARWRAAYDASMGRALAMKARIIGYNRLLAEMRANPRDFESNESDEWTLEPARHSLPHDDVRRVEKRARLYLHRCADEHMGTPWALLALRDMSTPTGWKWKEGVAKSLKSHPDGLAPANAGAPTRVRPAL